MDNRSEILETYVKEEMDDLGLLSLVQETTFLSDVIKSSKGLMLHNHTLFHKSTATI